MLESTPPSRVAIGTALAATFGLQFARWSIEANKWVKRRGALWVFFQCLRSYQGVRGIIAAEKAKIIAEMDADMRKKLVSEPPRLSVLPVEGMSSDTILSEVERRKRKDISWSVGGSTMSGAVYMADETHFDLLCSVYSTFAHSNPLHADAFPAVARMEAEIVNMTAAMLGGGVGSGLGVCGLMTSGGTESILTALRATRDYMRTTKGITRPEMIVAVSAHAAVYKAAEYFDITLVVCQSMQHCMDVAATRRAVNRNTILIYTSAPGYPHGSIDPISELADFARRRGICLHVDACLGGFVLPSVPKPGTNLGPCSGLISLRSIFASQV